jgi:hypothetical protein
MIETHRWKILFALWTIQGLVTLLWLLLIPTDAGDGILLGFSAARLALLGIVLGLLLFSAVLYFYEKLPIRDWFDIERRAGLWDFLYILALVVFAAAPAVIFGLRLMQGDPQYAAYADRLSPLAMWFWLSSLELIIVVAFSRSEVRGTFFSDHKSIWKIALVVFSIILAVMLAVIVTGIGITPDENMGAPATPVFEWQIFLILLALAAFAFLPKQIFALVDRWAVLCIYIFTVTLWLSQPVNTAYTATPPRAPNFEIYPFSDPQIYSQYAQSALAGNGFLYPEVPSRPLYIAFLTWFHLLGRQDYNNVVVLQSLLLALFPVMLYLIGRELGGRALGFGMAMMAAFRDMNANLTVPFASNVTYSKLLLSEVPLALFVSMFAYLVIRWLKREHASIVIPALAGVVLGAAALIRTQSVGLIVVIAVIAFLAIPDRKQWLVGMVALGIAFTLTLLPWLARNYAATGGLVLDNPVSQVMTMARRWSGSWGNESIPRLTSESDAEYSSRMTEIAIEAFRQNPQYILKTASNHFINSEIASLMVFPVRDEIRSPDELLIPQRAFWRSEVGRYQLPVLTLLVILFGIGIISAYLRNKWIGLFPLGLGLVYNFWTALFFSSGERFVMPLDWSVYLYQLLGLISLGTFALAFTRGANENASSWTWNLRDSHQVVQSPGALSRNNVILILVLILIVSVFIPFTEFIFPQKYPPITQQELEQRIGLTADDGEVVIYGRAVYPRYYYSGEGEPGTEKLGYRISEQARLIFFMVGSEKGLVIFELQDAPEFFPHTSDVYLIGTWTNGYFSPRAALVSKDGQSMVYQIP